MWKGFMMRQFGMYVIHCNRKVAQAIKNIWNIESPMEVFNEKRQGCIQWVGISWISWRSSLQRCSIKNGVFKHFTNFTGKRLCWSFFLITLFKNKLQHRYFLWNLRNFYEHPFWSNICKWLLLFMESTKWFAFC